MSRLALPALVLALAGVALCADARSALSIELSTPAPDELVGTVRAVDPDAGWVEVLTGVGHAIRLDRIRVYPSILVDIDGVMSWLDALEPGRIVRVVYRVTAEGKVAESVATLAAPGPRGAR